MLKIGHMEYPNLPERKLIDIPANSRASRVDKAKKASNTTWKIHQAVSSPSSIIFVMTENIYFRKYLLL